MNINDGYIELQKRIGYDFRDSDLLIKPSLKGAMKVFDATEYGGAPLLGLNGLVVKVHGNATEKEISNAIKQCETFKEQNISQRIADRIIIKDE